MAKSVKAKKKPTSESNARTWREIPQSGPKQDLSAAARRRKLVSLLKTSGSLLTLVVLLGALTWIGMAWLQSPEYQVGSAEGPPIRSVVLETDGVLSRDWVDLALNIPPGTSLGNVSIFDLKEKLEAHGQIAQAVVERRFPDALLVRLQERRPVSRLAVAREFGGFDVYLVSADGEVYEGHDYGADEVRALPFLDGVRVRRDGFGRIQRLEEMPLVAEFLSTAQRTHPRLYRDWRILAVEGMNGGEAGPGAGIRVRGRRYPPVRFSLQSFDRQLERLEHIINDLPDRLAPERHRQIEVIDVSLDGPAIVSFQKT